MVAYVSYKVCLNLQEVFPQIQHRLSLKLYQEVLLAT